jgi:hypothetical protein
MMPWLFVSMAHASAVYPGQVSDDLAMACVPQCTLCHETNVGGAGTVVSEFGLALVDRGLTGGGQVELLTAALDALALDGVDSDGDGVIDTDELAAGENPNGGDPLCGGSVVEPTYGCFNHTPGAVTTLGVLLAALGLRRRRQR